MSSPPASTKVQLERFVSRETIDLLGHFADRVLAWNRVHNIIGNSTAADIWTRHILDSVQLLPLLISAQRILDVGSGGGFPGLVIALARREEANFTIHLVESNTKKAAFLSMIAGEWDLPVQVHTKRIETLAQDIPRVDAVTARAFSSLLNSLDACSPWLLKPATFALFQKGNDFEREIQTARAKWSFKSIRHISVVQADSVILELRHVRPNGIDSEAR